MSGWYGNDLLYGHGSYDFLEGGRGHDTLYGGDDQDKLFGDEGNDYLSGQNGWDYLDGGDGDDILYGGNDADRLFGGAGNDTLSGGEGRDRLKGNEGNDIFDFNTNEVFDLDKMGIDVIADFGDGNDVINLDKTTFTALSSLAGKGFSNRREFAVVSRDDLVATSNAYILYSSSTGNLFYNENGAAAGLGNGGHFAILENAAELFANDFKISN